MALRAENKGGPRSKEQPEVTTHMARLVGLTTLGHQPGYTHNGNEIESSWKIEFTYELPNSIMKDGRPHWVSEEVKINDFEGKGITSTMMARVRTMDPANESNDGQDLTKLLGKPCMVTLSEGTNGFVKMKGQAAVGGIPLGLEVPPLVNDPFVFDMDEPDMERYESFPPFKQEKIKRALNLEETELYRQLQMDEDF
jgi:hypothetical protein